MKNISFLLVLSFLFFASVSWAQPTFYINPDYQLVNQDDQVCYKIKTIDFSFLLSVSFTLEWNPGVLSNASVTPSSLHPLLTGLDMGDFMVNNAEGYLTFVWSNGQPCNVTDPNQNVTLFTDNETLFEVCFTATGTYGNHTEIQFTDEPVDMEVKRYNANCQDIGEFVYDGFCSIGTDPLRINISSADGFQGETVCVDFKVENFDNLVTNQYYIFYDPNVLLFENVIASGLPGFQSSNLNFSIPGLGVVSWNSIGSPVTVPDGTQILQLCFKIIGNCGQRSPIYIDDNGDELIEIIDYITTNTNGTNIGLLDSPGEVSVKCYNPNGIDMTIEDKNVCPGETFTVDVTVGNFYDIVKLQFGLKWNPSIIQLLNTSGDGISFPPNDNTDPCFNFDTPGVLKTFPSQGKIEVNWSVPFIGDCDMNDGQLLMRLHFKAVGPGGTNSTISVVNPILVDRLGGQVVNVGINNDNGLVSICELQSPTLIAQPGESNPGENICIGVTTFDFEDVITSFFNISWEPSILSFTGVQNFNLPGLNDFSFLTGQTLAQGDLGVAWDAGVPVSVPNGTTIFEVCFDVIGDPDSCSLIQFTDNFIPLNIVTAESNGTNVGLNGQGSQVCVLDPFDFFLQADDIYGTPGQHVTVDISVENFIQLKKLQHTINWNTNIVRYDSLVSTGAIPNFNQTHFNDSSPAIDNGQMYVNWNTNNINGVTVPDGAAIYTLHFTIVGNPGDCSGVKINNWLVPIEVKSVLTGNANLGLEVDNGSVCVNQSFVTVADINITEVDCPSSPTGAIDLTVQGGSGNYNYNWNGKGITPGLEDQINLAPGFYSVTVTDTDNPSLKVVLENLQVGLSPTAPVANAGQDTSFACLGGVATLTLNGGGSSQSGVTYAWSPGPGFPGIITGGGSTLYPTVIGGSSYILTVTRNSPLCVVKDTVKVSAPVYPNPIIEDIAIKEISCIYDTITLNGGQPQNIFTFEWCAGPGGHIVPGTETTLQPKVTEPGMYYLKMKHPQTTCSDIDSIYIEENRVYPDAVAGDDTSIGCSDDFITLNGVGSSVDDVTYKWLPLLGGQICGADDQLDINACGPGAYQLIITNTLSGCTSMDEVIVVGDTLRPTSNAGPSMILTCAIDTVILDGSASSQGSEYFYFWLNGIGDTVSTEIAYSTDTEGLYTLSVLNQSNGCGASSEVTVEQDKQQPIATAIADGPITCDSVTSTLDGAGSSVGNEFVYEWMSPTGSMVGTDLTIEVGEPGTYVLFVKNTENDCVEEVSVLVEDQNDPIPVEAGDDTIIGCGIGVQLEGSFTSANANIQIQWSGPGISNCITGSTTTTPTMICPGKYYMTVFDPATGCLGIDSLVLIPDDTKPVVNAGMDAVFPCSLDEFQLSGTSDLTDVSVLWTNQNSLPINDQTTLTPSVVLPGTYQLIVTNNANQCTGNDFVIVTAPVLPTAVISGDNDTDCGTPIAILSGIGSTAGVNYLWTAISGNVPAAQATQVEVEVPAGEYVLTITDNNGCTDSATQIVAQNGIEPIANAGSDNEIPCGGDFVVLDGSGSDPGLTYVWTNASGMIVGSGLTAQVSTPGLYTLTVTNSANLCTSIDMVLVSQATSGATPAEASFDHDPCAIEAMLMGNLPTGATGVWTTSTGASIQEPSIETTLATNLNEGQNVFNWTLSLGTCQNYSTAQIVIDIDQSVPNPNNDAVTLGPGTGGVIVIDVLQNDSFDPAQTTFNVLPTNFPGDITASPDGVVTYTKIKCFIGEVEIMYELCNIDCPELCKTAILTIDVKPDAADECDKVPNGITPNGDGLNDELVFDALLNTTEDYPNNEIIIFNRWGDIVYQAKPYLNNWSGTNDKGGSLPHATYYYILRLDIANNNIIRGDVTILK